MVLNLNLFSVKAIFIFILYVGRYYKDQYIVYSLLKTKEFVLKDDEHLDDIYAKSFMKVYKTIECKIDCKVKHE